MTVRELNESIKKINPNLVIDYVECANYQRKNKHERTHRATFDIYDIRTDKDVVKAGVDEDAKPYIYFINYMASGKSKIDETAKLIASLKDFLADFRGYVE